MGWGGERGTERGWWYPDEDEEIRGVEFKRQIAASQAQIICSLSLSLSLSLLSSDELQHAKKTHTA